MLRIPNNGAVYVAGHGCRGFDSLLLFVFGHIELVSCCIICKFTSLERPQQPLRARIRPEQLIDWH